MRHARQDHLGPLAVPAATVRGWLRRLRARSGQLLQEAKSRFGRLAAVIETPEERDPSPPGPNRIGDRGAGPEVPAYGCVVAAKRRSPRRSVDVHAGLDVGHGPCAGRPLAGGVLPQRAVSRVGLVRFGRQPVL